MKKPRIAFFLQQRLNIETTPFVREPILQLASDGCSIDLFAPLSENSFDPNFAPQNVHVIDFDCRSRRALLRSIPRMALPRRYALVLANPVEALICGAFVAQLMRIPLVAFSDELFTEDDISPMPLRRRRLMNWAHRRAEFTVITDSIRADVLRRTAGLSQNHTFYELPNSPAGLPEAIDKKELRNQTDVPDDATILMTAGYFAPAMGSDSLLKALPGLPENTYLVFQISGGELSTPDAVTLCRLAEKKYPVRFLFDPVPYGRVDGVIAGCDIGLVFYNSRGPNFELCGKGSGKLNRFLRLGKPVIVNHQGSLDWIARYGAGEVAHTTDELVQAIRKIRASYDTYAKRAVSCYREHFAFEKYFPPIHQAIRELVRVV